MVVTCKTRKLMMPELKAMPSEEFAEVQATVLLAGLPEMSMLVNIGRASKDAVRCAFKSCGYEFPYQKKVVAQVVGKKTTSFGTMLTADCELPIAIAILAATEQIDPKKVEGREFSGLLKLDGTVYTYAEENGRNPYIGKTLREVAQSL